MLNKDEVVTGRLLAVYVVEGAHAEHALLAFTADVELSSAIEDNLVLKAVKEATTSASDLQAMVPTLERQGQVDLGYSRCRLAVLIPCALIPLYARGVSERGDFAWPRGVCDSTTLPAAGAVNPF